MKKHLTAGRILRYLLCLGIACTFVGGVTYARYISEVSGSATAVVAAVAMNVTGNGEGSSSELDLTKELGGMRPGDNKTLVFAVTNQMGGAVSEVALEYSITIHTTGNLPLIYDIKKSTVEKSDAGETELLDSGSGDIGTYVNPNDRNKNGDTEWLWSGGSLPYMQGGVTHTYQLTVEWPGSKKEENLADEIDWVTLTVDAKQALPSESNGE